jgi:hypothetical protein
VAEESDNKQLIQILSRVLYGALLHRLPRSWCIQVVITHDSISVLSADIHFIVPEAIVEYL